MKIDIYNDGIGFVTDEVSTIKTSESNLNEENRIKFVTDLAAVSRGKSESKNPPARYKSLIKEAAPTWKKVDAHLGNVASEIKKNSETVRDNVKGSPSRPLEFLPVVLRCYMGDQGKILLTKKAEGTIKLDINTPNRDVYHTLTRMDFYNYLVRFSYIECTDDSKELVIYTNMRACINVGIPYELIPYNTPAEVREFRAIKAKVPMFTWAQVPNTHVMISKEAETDRHKTKPLYWMPADFRQKVYEYHQKHDIINKTELQKQLLLKDNNMDGTYSRKIFCQLTLEILSIKDGSQIPYFLTNGSKYASPTQHDIQEYFKEIGYPAEIYQRAMYYFKYKTVVMTGWNNDPKVWTHLLIERSVRPDIWENWTQDITKNFVSGIKQIITGV